MKKISLISLLVLGAFVLSACSGRTAVNTWPGLAADAARAYLADGSAVYAIDLKTGKEAWHYPATADATKLVYYANPVLTSDGQLLIGSEGTTHGLVSIDPQTGKDNWAQPFLGAQSKWVASPLVFNDKIYAPNTDGFIYVLDMKGNQVADPIDIGGALWSAPVTDGKYIYIASLDHHLHVIDPATNKSGQPVDLGGAAPGSPAVTTDGVYVGSFASNVELIKSNGNHEVVAKASNWIWGTPALDGNTLYYADLDGNVFSQDITSGKQNWTTDAVQTAGMGIVASPLVVGDQIYVATEAGTLFALDKDGKIVWQKDLAGAAKGKIYTSPVASGDLILVAPYKADFFLAAYDAAGKQAWTFTPAK